ncbi:MAG TPA: hypothetical protein VF997_03410, partial [Polyangia bacterium]
MSRALVVSVAALALAGCATIDVYHYQARPLPAGSQPLAVVSWTLQDLRNVSWSYGEPDPDPSRRATLEATPSGVSASSRLALAQGSPLDLSYAEIADGVRMVTESAGAWTIYIYDRHNRLIQMEFASYAAARLFLDASTALAAAPPVEVAS